MEEGLLPPAKSGKADEETPGQELRRKLIAECIGTALLAACVSLQAGPIAAGFCLTSLVYAFGDISGGMFNPAVALAVWLRGKMSLKEAGYYSIAQLVGACVGALFSFGITTAGGGISMPGFPMPSEKLTNIPMLATFLSEFLGTFALVTVVLNVATTKKSENKSYYGLAIGFTISQGAFTLGGISGGAFNPAIGIVLPLVGGHPDISQAMYLAAPLLAAAAATGLFRLTAHPDDLKDSSIHVS